MNQITKLTPDSFFETEFSDESFDNLLTDLKQIDSKIFEVDFILRENKLVDLYKVVKDSVILSSENYRLKTIEKFYKLDREEDIASGQDSLVAFEKYLDSGHKEILDEIIKYNEQDCKSLIYLQEWLISIKPDEIDIPEKIEEEN